VARPSRPSPGRDGGNGLSSGSRGPVVVGYDGSPASECALREGGALLAPRPALVVVVWEAGAAFELMESSLGLLPAPLDVRTALELDRAIYDGARRLAEHGAALARRLGLAADGLAVADDVTVAETLVRLARECDAQALVVGAHGHGALREVALGSTAYGVVHGATCPVIVVRAPSRSSRREGGAAPKSSCRARHGHRGRLSWRRTTSRSRVDATAGPSGSR
jgi:nucleotide-binding universal stress UspA family protein